jgi:peroxiredoxin
MGMLIGKNHLGFGNRSWRYMCVINDNTIEKWWQEPGINNEGTDDDPYIESTPDNMVKYLNKNTNAEMNTMVGIDVSANDNYSV